MILAYDQHIPLVDTFFGEQFDLLPLPTEAIHHHAIQQADILLVRSVTAVNPSLLADSSIRIVASATSGSDHIDHDYLQQARIACYTAPGCNANSVAQYVLCTIALLQQQQVLTEEKLRVGIIGVGHIGRLVAQYCELLGYETVLNDPPRASQEANFSSIPLTAFTDIDLLCIHPSLQRSGVHANYQLIDKTVLSTLPAGCVILNASRGEIINEQDLLAHGQHLHWCLDVFANEPAINPKVVMQAKLVTPHIAGYAIESKARATAMVYHAICQHLQLPIKPQAAANLTTIDCAQADWQTAALAIYNPASDQQRFQAAIADSTLSQAFQSCRRHYPTRHEFQLINSSKKVV